MQQLPLGVWGHLFPLTGTGAETGSEGGRGQGAGGAFFPPGRALTPECLPTGVLSYLENLEGGVHLGAPVGASAPYLRAPLKGTYLSLQAPFHSTRPQGFRTRIRVSVLPRYQIWGGAGKGQGRGAGGGSVPPRAPPAERSGHTHILKAGH